MVNSQEDQDTSGAQGVVAALIAWYRTNKRQLPWRGADAYGVWISEIMLQQTQVATVIPYYLRFMNRFPSVEALAAAPIDDVLQHWAGLGYYARARNLHRAANQITERFAGRMPDTLPEILSLPGIGNYTAGAVLSIAYDRPYAAIDANVIRVISRLYGVKGDPKTGPVMARIQELTSNLVPEPNPGEFNQALMELGALVCDPAEPRCDACPLLVNCVAGNSDNPAALPEIPAGKAVTSLTHSCVILLNSKGEALLCRRPPHGLWGGLWEFPRVVCKAGEPPDEGAHRAAKEIAGIALEDLNRLRRLTTVKHTVTRYRITLHAWIAETDGQAAWKHLNPEMQYNHSANYDSFAWVSPDSLGAYALSSPQALVRAALAGTNLTKRHPERRSTI